jgi:hypothetical protein
VIVVIQCASRKQPGAGHLVTGTGKPVCFVAHPELAPDDPTCLFARPDDPDSGGTWRKALLAYNDNPNGNPLGLYPAYQLYGNEVYGRLVDRYGVERVYILSAGWGLIRADFLTPYYDITFSQAAEPYKRRTKTDRYYDLRMLANDTNDTILFLGGKDYLPLFTALTNAIRSTKIVFYNSVSAPQFSGYTLRRFETTTRTNWHYECANALLDGVIQII